MPITSRPIDPAVDLPGIIALAFAHPDTHLHVADLPYRLSSPALETSANGQLWESGGDLKGWAVYQTPWGMLDYGLAGADADLEDQVLDWGIERFRQLGREHGTPLDYYVAVPEGDGDRRARLERHDFQPGDFSIIRLRRDLGSPLPSPLVPAGFALRPLGGLAEVQEYVAAHRAAFGTTSMTVPWRERLLAMPHYEPALDMVVTGPGGRLAAFCVGWLGPGPDGALLGLIEPMGVHPDFQRLGLGRAVLLKVLQTMQAFGAGTAVVETFGFLGPAQRLYEASGFHPERRILTYSREF